MGRTRLMILVVLVSCAACQIPRDPEGTLERIRGGTVRVGVTENEPWTSPNGQTPTGVEPSLVESLADSLDARVEWVEGSTEELLTAVEELRLDLAIGGFVEDDPWSTQVSLTHPYAVTRIVVAAPPGANLPDDIDGLEVAVERGSAAGGLVEDEGGIPVEVDELRDASGLVATEHWRAEALGLRVSDITLAEEKHVLAAPLGENAWLVTVERFLLDPPISVDDLLRSAA